MGRATLATVAADERAVEVPFAVRVSEAEALTLSMSPALDASTCRRSMLPAIAASQWCATRGVSPCETPMEHSSVQSPILNRLIFEVDLIWQAPRRHQNSLGAFGVWEFWELGWE